MITENPIYGCMDGINVQLVLASAVECKNGEPEAPVIVTMEMQYPRFIHGELMTHRVFSRNAASSRAIPAKEIRAQVWNRPAMPVHWGQNQSGMQAQSTLKNWRLWSASKLWRASAKTACVFHYMMEKVGLHKQVCNRVLEPWMMMNVVVTATEWDNFLHLRDHKDAQPEFQKLAQAVACALGEMQPQILKPGDWHTPYAYIAAHEGKAPSKTAIDNALRISVSVCAQSSFRRADHTMQKATRIWKRLLEGERFHASPFEHQARAIKQKGINHLAHTDGITHVDAEGNYWSANFKGWVQHRQLLGNEPKRGARAA